MPLPIVYPKRKKWYNQESGTRKKRFSPDDASDSMVVNIDDYIKLNRRKFYLIDDFDQGVFDELSVAMKKVQFVMAKECTIKLRELIEERAYVEYNSGRDSVWYNRSFQFPTAFDVFVYIKPNRLDYRINFYYESLYTSPAVHRISRISVGEESEDVNVYKELMARYLSIYGVDTRKDLPDILNTPVTTYESKRITDKRRRKKTRLWYGGSHTVVKTGKRQGRWYEAFDKWFRTEGYERFKELCKMYHII